MSKPDAVVTKLQQCGKLHVLDCDLVVRTDMWRATRDKTAWSEATEATKSEAVLVPGDSLEALRQNS
jgi:hypothetical protein